MNAHHHSRCTPGAALALVISTSLLSVYSSHNRSKSSALRPSNDFEPTHNRNGSVVHEPHGLALPCGREQLDAGSSSSVWAKRDLPPPLTYGRAVCIGNKLWNMIQDAYNGKGPKPQAFTLEDADNGWTTDENNSHLPDRWDDAYDLMVESVGGEVSDHVPVIPFVEFRQDQPFHNAAGALVTASPPIPHICSSDTTLSLIQHWILPDQNAIIAQYVNSPYNKLRSRNHPPPPPNSSLPDLVPPLHRLSDIAWLSWAELSRTPHTLQYIGHDYITNSDTKRIMNLIFRASAGVDWMGWPGLEFGVETWEGRALLGTPNSGNVAWLLVARAGVMGRRGLRVRIWAKGYEMLEPVPCLLWNMMVLE
ncbi:MAG: hypothetical protein LQ350_005241 [Teloschistes chrysophthalmus]|nr:MAG: hypothetical protein LQ350_005241 [Niorma chrysophthalma]